MSHEVCVHGREIRDDGSCSCEVCYPVEPTPMERELEVLRERVMELEASLDTMAMKVVRARERSEGLEVEVEEVREHVQEALAEAASMGDQRDAALEVISRLEADLAAWEIGEEYQECYDAYTAASSGESAALEEVARLQKRWAELRKRVEADAYNATTLRGYSRPRDVRMFKIVDADAVLAIIDELGGEK